MEMTLEKLGYGVMAVGSAIFVLTSYQQRSLSEAEAVTGLWAGTLVFLAGVAIAAYQLSRERRS